MRATRRLIASAGLRLVSGASARARRRGLAGLLACVACGLIAFAILPSVGSGASTQTPSPNQSPTSIVRELPELRTETSDTFLRADGTRATKISRDPVNYRDSSGNWQPIETTLKPGADGTLSAQASELPVTLPASLASPVSVGREGETVSFSLQEGAGSATASGSSATYAEALPQVSAAYEEQPTRLNETLTLQSAAAPSVYRYHLSTSPGLTPKLQSGTIVFQDAQGHPRYVMPAPSLADSGAGARPDPRAVHYELSEDGSELSVVIDSAWLQSPERVFPVKLDPTVEYWGDDVDCTIASGSTYENTSLCGTVLAVGYHSSGSSVGRGLLRFSLGTAIPEDATILSSALSLYVESSPAGTQKLELYGLETTPTNSATWNTYDGTHTWKTAGAKPEGTAPPTSTATVNSASYGHRIDFGITPLVESWLKTPTSNHGVLIKAENESTLETEFADDHYAENPYVEIDWTPKIGTPGDATLLSQQLSDREGLSVDVADGNLLVQNHVLELPGIGFDLSLSETYNNQEYSWRNLGMGAILSTGQDVRLVYDEVEGSWAYADPSGTWWRFTRNSADDREGDKAFTATGLDAILYEESSGALYLEYVTARVKYYFNNNKYPSFLQKIEDPNKNTETMHYNAEGISSIEDTHGHTITFTHEKAAGEYTSAIKDSLGRKWEFIHNSDGQLTAVKDPDGHESKYTYDEADNLTQIEDPDGHLIELSYGPHNAISEIRHVVNGTATSTGSKDVITTFNYERPAKASLSCPSGSIGSTEVVSPNGSPEGKVDYSESGHKTDYCYNAEDQVTKTIDQRGNESTASYAPASGNLTEYENPGDKAEGSGGPTNTIAYNSSGAPTKITEGISGSDSLETTLEYMSSGSYGKVEPSSIQTPYSAPGQRATKTTPRTHQTFYGYDEHGNLTSVNQDTEAGKPEAKLKYDAQGQVTESTDPDGNVTKYKYSEASGHEKGDLIKIEPPSPLGKTELTYDSLDRVHSVKDGRGNTATYTYDGEDRVTKVEYSDGSSVSFKYDADGNTTERVDAKSFGEPYTGATLYEYDKLNRPTLETTPTGKSIRYGYDYDGNLTSFEDPGGTVSYAYGSDDLLTSLTEPENSSHPFKFGYQTGTDTRESTTFPNGLLQCTKTDPAGRLTSFLVFKPSGEQNCQSSLSAGSTLEDYGLSYAFEEEVENEEGHKETISVDTPDLQTLKNEKAGNATKYSYDTLDRLLKAVTKAGSEPASLTSEYEYDNAGNIKLNHTFSPTTTYSNEHMLYNAANEICAIATSTPSACAKPSEPGIAGEPTYDEDGNMTSDGLLSGADKFAYDVREQLTSITPHGESAKQVVSHGTGQDDLAAIGSEEVITNVLGVGSTGSGESAKYYTRGSEGTLFAERTAKGKRSETEYFVLDPFGSVAMLTSYTGSQTEPKSTERYEYDPYGASVGLAPWSVGIAFGFESGLVMPAELVHFGARYDDPISGVWTQQDPLSQLSSLTQGDRYAYAGDNPVNQQDETGEALIGEGEGLERKCPVGQLYFNHKCVQSKPPILLPPPPPDHPSPGKHRTKIIEPKYLEELPWLPILG